MSASDGMALHIWTRASDFQNRFDLSVERGFFHYCSSKQILVFLLQRRYFQFGNMPNVELP